MLKVQNARNVLIADDNLINRRILKTVLGSEYNIIEAEDGLQVMDIQKTRGDEVSVVLLDILMPGMDGYEVLRAVRADPKYTSLPIVVTTQQDDMEAEPVALALGATDYLPKPYRPEIIKQRVRNLIQLRESAVFIDAMERDSVSGLYTEEAFARPAQRILDAGAYPYYYMIAMDMDRFELVNEIFGLEEGNQILQFLGRSIMHTLKNTGGVATRTKGTKFFMLCPAKAQGDEKEVIRFLREGLASYPVDFILTPRFGVYPVDKKTSTATTMCEMARTALNAAEKRIDDPVVYYDEAFQKKVMEEAEITFEMRSALEEGQFRPYYQPKYNLQTGELQEAEALVRWIHPERGMMSPGSYIPIFERNGFITQMDLKLWDAVCANIRHWMDTGLDPVPVSVNVSWVDIYNPNLATLLRKVVDKYTLPTGMLHLEITETVYTQNPRLMIKTLRSLREAGFVIEVDNFGLGYSSLNMLNKIPVDELKLDMRLLDNNLFVKGNRSVIKFIVEMAQDMGLSVIAEGIETADDYLYLKQLGCQMGQGYYLSSPLPENDFAAVLKEKRQLSK
ncbi:MAG: EAL domain-containing protein [Eubacteriales bacterium]|nr:EAL domain-containing protein [Eubacteriales bacterium]